jgi:hypothetical protein
MTLPENLHPQTPGQSGEVSGAVLPLAKSVNLVSVVIL